uniref:TATA box binding protein associated factor (TAF) histone-like fold domain-containing protein n=1 Tax=Hyaloperonospora arabidopsidis (strain Emoy2) TaxID=559515 RepID=M4BHA3_HYAAE
MSLLRPEMLQVVAQSLGLDDISSDCVGELMPEIELRVREVVQDALKFQRHSRRSQLDPTHINQALHYRPCEDHESLFFAVEEELELSELLNAPLGQIPLQPVLNVHWLAVDGVQPLIPENESVEDDSTCHTSIKDEAFVNNIDRKPRVKHVLTEEMQLYYTKVTEAVKGDNFELQRAAFTSLAQDPGIHQLLPYFSRFIYEELCENPADDHWALRKYAAKLVAQICERYSEKYANIQARVSKTYHKAIIDPVCPFSTQYGALHGLCLMFLRCGSCRMIDHWIVVLARHTIGDWSQQSRRPTLILLKDLRHKTASASSWLWIAPCRHLCRRLL